MDVWAYVPINTGPNTTVYPPDSGGSPTYGGTVHSVDGLSDTKTITVQQWTDPGQAAQILTYITNVWNCISNTYVEGTVTYRGLYAPALTQGQSLTISASGYTVPYGWDAMAIPVSQVELSFEGSTLHTTTMRVSNRREPFGSEMFLRPARTGLTFGPADGGYLAVGGATDVSGASPYGIDTSAYSAESSPFNGANFGKGSGGESESGSGSEGSGGEAPGQGEPGGGFEGIEPGESETPRYRRRRSPFSSGRAIRVNPETAEDAKRREARQAKPAYTRDDAERDDLGRRATSTADTLIATTAMPAPAHGPRRGPTTRSAARRSPRTLATTPSGTIWGAARHRPRIR